MRGNLFICKCIPPLHARSSSIPRIRIWPMSEDLLDLFPKKLLQANETGGSNQTELEGVKRWFGFLRQLGVTIGVFISDGHRGIAKWIRENCPGTTHFYDIWHVTRSITKKLLAASKEKGCEIIQDWMKGIR